ncbi:MAG: hypothetical protein ACJ74Z_23120 [Bryobacteraceae bacterium]
MRIRSGTALCSQLCLFLAPGALVGQSKLPITFEAATPTQATFTYSAPDSSPCIVQESTDPAFSTVDHDTDPNLFPGSNLDTRAGNIVNGPYRHIVVGFRGTATALDGHTYSRALQAAVTHYLKITCDGRSSIGSYTFQTQNPPLGNTAPDYIPFNRANFGNYGWPTIDYSAPTSDPHANSYIDPLTGVQLVRWTGPGDGGGITTSSVWYGISDPSSAWTNPSNVLVSSGYASYSGPGGPTNALYIWGPSGIFRPSFTGTEFFSLDDLQLGLNGYGDQSSAADRTVNACISADFGATCLDNNSIQFVFPKATASSVWQPSHYPSPILSGWGSPHVTNDMLTNSFFGTLSAVSGSAVTWGGQSSFGSAVYFPVTVLKPGMKVAISGSAPICPQNQCTIASVQDEQHLTIEQSLPNWTPLFTTLTSDVDAGASTFAVGAATGFVVNPSFRRAQAYAVTIDIGTNADSPSCTTLTGNTFSGCSGINHSHSSGTQMGQNAYGFVNFGIKIWKTSGAGTIYLNSALANWAVSNMFFTEYQGTGSTGCNGNYVSVSYAADGVTPIAPTQGYTCTFVDNFFVGAGGDIYLYLLIPSTGETRKLSNLNNGAVVNNGTPLSGWGYNPSSGYMQSCVYNDNPSNAAHQKFAAWTDNRNASLMNSAIACMNPQTSYTVQQEIGAAYPQIDFGYFGVPGLTDIEYPSAKFMMRPEQGAMAWFCDLDISKAPGPSQVLSCHNSWDTYPSRFAGVHGFEYFINNTGAYSTGYSDEYATVGLNSPSVGGLERWDIAIHQIYNNGGSTALDATFTDPETCEQLGVTDSRWIALGATAHNCVQMDVQDPVATAPASKDMQALGTLPAGSRPAPWRHNSTACGGDGRTGHCWSFLEPIAEGDMLIDNDQSASHELFIVAAVTAITGNPNATAHIVLSRYFNPFGQCASSGSTPHSSGFFLIETQPWTCSGAAFILYPNGNLSRGKVDNTTLNAGHIIQWPIKDKFILSGPYVVDFANDLGGYGTGYGVRMGTIPDVWGQNMSWGVQSLFPFNQSFNSLGIDYIQTHAGGLTSGCPNCEWIVDGRPLGGAAGGSGQLWNHNYILMPGTQSVYKLDLPNGNTLDFKNKALRLFAGQHLIQNISSPTSRVSDSIPWQGCAAYASGECYPGSHAGDIYEVVPQASSSLGYCAIDMTINTPCAVQVGPEVAAYTQHDISGPDPLGLRGRVLTMGFNGPARTNNYANMHALTNGDWGITTVVWGDGRRSDVFGVKLPPLPNNDSIIRNTFVHVPVSLGGQSGSSVRIRFGYAEYGSDANAQPLFCSSNRQEDCSTATVNSQPFAFASESQHWAACSTDCLIDIPAVSGRVLYYVVDRKMHSGSIISSSLEMIAVP